MAAQNDSTVARLDTTASIERGRHPCGGLLAWASVLSPDLVCVGAVLSGSRDVAEAVAQVVQPVVPVVGERGDALHRAAGEIDELGRRDAVHLGPLAILR